MTDPAKTSVRAWSEPVVIPTYPTMPADRNPMFLEKRVYQGSSGRVYPNQFTDRVSDERVDRTWQAVHLENEFVRLMILPELGGRIQVGQDKTNGYDFFYRQQRHQAGARRACRARGSPAASSSTGRSTTARPRSCLSTGRSRRSPTAPGPSGAPTTTRSTG